jgi:hypothetical protein
MSSTIQYNFKNEQDLGFYILNAVCHDWIHDFNNYKRMSKILNYIMALIPSSKEMDSSLKEMSESSGIVSSFIEEDVSEITPIIDINDKNLEDTTLVNEEPNLVNEDTNLLNIQELDSQPAAKKVKRDSSIEEPYSDSNTQESYTQLSDTGEKRKRDSSIEDPYSGLNIKELYESQAEQYLDTSSDLPIIPEISGLEANQKLVENSINVYINIKLTTRTRYMTRGNVRKINILQKLDEFINESKLLIISKLTSSEIVSSDSDSIQIGGSSGIDIIKINDISLAINRIKKEIDEEQNISNKDKQNLKNIFELINQVFLNFNIPDISPLEKFNNSLIVEITSMFIANKCKSIDIIKEAKLYLKTLTSSPQEISNYDRPVAEGVATINKNALEQNDKDYLDRPPSPISIANEDLYGGGSFSEKIYNENRDKWTELESKISIIQSSTSNLFNIYKGNVKIDDTTDLSILNNEFYEFISGIDLPIKLIVGQQMYNVKIKQIENLFKFYKNTKERNKIKYSQQTIDSINDFVFDKIISSYEDIKNRLRAKEEDAGEKGILSGEAKQSVQQISKLVAVKTLELMGYLKDKVEPSNNFNLDFSKFRGNKDLTSEAQIILQTVNSGKGYTTVDNSLISYFNNEYSKNPNFSQGTKANQYLINQLKNCRGNCRVINNAIPNGEVKDSITNSVVCPTSSVCDGMGAFGSCINPSARTKEYFNMDFIVTTSGDSSNYYLGSTLLKSNNNAVNINYGFQFNELQVYNFLDINISTQPIILQANYTFKSVINRIIEIWKSASTETSINSLWEMLYFNDYFISILKLGSQKAVGDIFQEINSTLDNGGYISSSKTQINSKKTFGLMGDRPSGIRVIKLLKDSESGVNPKASGGYIGEDSSLIYLPNLNTFGMLGGKRKTIKKLKYRKKNTHRKKIFKRINKSIKKRKYKNKKTRTI